jgi:hypothetical protein
MAGEVSEGINTSLMKQADDYVKEFIRSGNMFVFEANEGSCGGVSIGAQKELLKGRLLCKISIDVFVIVNRDEHDAKWVSSGSRIVQNPSV